MKTPRRRYPILWIAAPAAILLLVFLITRLWRPFPPPQPKYTLPAGSQLLSYPLEDGLITAGYLNQRYLEKNKFNHFGTDIMPRSGKEARVYASGMGTVLGTEFCDNNVGNVVVARYDRVYDPTRKIVTSVVIRYYHMLSLSVKGGDALSPGQVIGSVDGRHKWYNHVHVEVDADTVYPFHTPQVAEHSSELLIRFPASGDSLLDPVSVLAVRKGGQIGIHPHSDCCAEKDAPCFFAAEYAADGGE